MIVVENLHKAFGKNKALDGLSLDLRQGIYGLLGINGAGKTTFIRILVGLLKPDQGKIYFKSDRMNGEAVGQDYLDSLGYLPQHIRFYRSFTCTEMMRYMGILKGMDESSIHERSEQLLKTVNLWEDRNKPIRALSGGMIRRLGIAMAMVNDPHMLILDEPTAGLDPIERIRFRNLIAQFSGDRIILVATHIVSDIESLADRIIMIDKGRVLRNDTPLAMIEEMKGHVFEVNLPIDTPSNDYESWSVTGMSKHTDKLTLRVLSHHPPANDATLLQPELEDAFLYYCGEQ